MAYGQPYNQQPFTGVQVGVTGGNQYWGQQQQGVPSQQDRASGRGGTSSLLADSELRPDFKILGYTCLK